MHMIVFDSLSSSAQCKKQWYPDPNPIPNPNPNPNPDPDPNPIPHPKPNPKRLFSRLRRLRCDICVAPNTDSLQCGVWAYEVYGKYPIQWTEIYVVKI